MAITPDELRELYEEYSKYETENRTEGWTQKDYWDGVCASEKDLFDGFFKNFVAWLEYIKEQ